MISIGQASGASAVFGAGGAIIVTIGAAAGMSVVAGFSAAVSVRRWAFPAGSANGGTLAPNARGGMMSRG